MTVAVLTATCSNPLDICSPQESDLSFFSKGDCIMTRSSFFQGHEWLTVFGNADLPADDRFSPSEIHAIAEGNRRVDWPKELLVHLNVSLFAYISAVTEYTDRNDVQKLHFLLTDANGSREAAADSQAAIREFTKAAARDWIANRARALAFLGKANHILQDSFSEAHTFREREHAERPWCIVRVKSFTPRRDGHETYADGSPVLFHGGSTDDDGNRLTDDSIGHTTTEDSIYREGRDCNDPTTRGHIENCLNDHAQRARLATKDYLAAVRRILKGAASVVDPDALVDQEIDAHITEHLSLCPDAPN